MRSMQKYHVSLLLVAKTLSRILPLKISRGRVKGQQWKSHWIFISCSFISNMSSMFLFVFIFLAKKKSAFWIHNLSLLTQGQFPQSPENFLKNFVRQIMKESSRTIFLRISIVNFIKDSWFSSEMFFRDLMGKCADGFLF